MSGHIYLICAVAGGTLFVLQMVLQLFGHDGGHDVSHDGTVADHDGHFWGVFSFRAIVAAVTAFGLGGLLVRSMGQPVAISAPLALAFGLVAMTAVAVFFRLMGKLSDDGTARIENAIGARGVVYLPIPGDKQGIGKVHLNLQHRTMELEAVTYDNQLPTGTCVIVTAVVGPGTVEVIAAPEMGNQYEPARTT
jgi:hypothetical protein